MSERKALKRSLRLRKVNAYFKSLVPDFCNKISALIDIGLAPAIRALSHNERDSSDQSIFAPMFLLPSPAYQVFLYDHISRLNDLKKNVNGLTSFLARIRTRYEPA
jgi:hypothetical protein